MEDRIRKEVDKLLRKQGNEKVSKEKREEIIKDLVAKYRDLIEVGKSPEEAYHIVMGSMEELKSYEQESKQQESVNRSHQQREIELREKKAPDKKGGLRGFAVSMILIAGCVGGMLALTINNKGNLVRTGDAVTLKDLTKNTLKGLKDDIQYEDKEDSNLKSVKNNQAGLTGIHTIKCELGRAQVTLSLTEGEELEISESTDDPDEKELYEMKQVGESLIITRDDGAIHFGHQPKHKVDLHIPLSYKEALSIGTSSGDIYLLSDVNVSDIELVTASGDINAAQIFTGEAEIASASGEVEVDGFSGAGKLSTASGDISLGIQALTGDLKIESASGDVELEFNEAVNAAVEFNTLSGEIEGNVKAEYKGMDKRQGQGAVGTGEGNNIKVQTLSGDITLKE